MEAMMEAVMKAMMPHLMTVPEFAMTRDGMKAGIAMIESRCLRGGH